MKNSEFKYSIYINLNNATIEVYKYAQLEEEPIKNKISIKRNSFLHVGDFISKKGYMTEGLKVADKESDRVSFPVVIKFDYRIEPVELIYKRKKEARVKSIELLIIVCLITTILWKLRVLVVSI